MGYSSGRKSSSLNSPPARSRKLPLPAPALNPRTCIRRRVGPGDEDVKVPKVVVVRDRRDSWRRVGEQSLGFLWDVVDLSAWFWTGLLVSDSGRAQTRWVGWARGEGGERGRHGRCAAASVRRELPSCCCPGSLLAFSQGGQASSPVPATLHRASSRERSVSAWLSWGWNKP